MLGVLAKQSKPVILACQYVFLDPFLFSLDFTPLLRAHSLSQERARRKKKKRPLFVAPVLLAQVLLLPSLPTFFSSLPPSFFLFPPLSLSIPLHQRSPGKEYKKKRSKSRFGFHFPIIQPVKTRTEASACCCCCAAARASAAALAAAALSLAAAPPLAAHPPASTPSPFLYLTPQALQRVRGPRGPQRHWGVCVEEHERQRCVGLWCICGWHACCW